MGRVSTADAGDEEWLKPDAYLKNESVQPSIT